MAELHVDVVAAEGRVWSGAASLVVARTTEGEIGIMPGHESVLALLASGPVTVHTAVPSAGPSAGASGTADNISGSAAGASGSAADNTGGSAARAVPSAGGIFRAAVHGGFLSVSGDNVSILAEVAETADDIDPKRAEESMSRAVNDGDEAARRRAETRLLVAGIR